MEQITIDPTIENQRLDKFLKKYLPNAGTSFLYKMLRKKNIVLNNKKATGKELLKNKDQINIYFSDETLEKFKSAHDETEMIDKMYVKAYQSLKNQVSIVFENEDIMILNKASGILSQKTNPSDLCINDFAIGYMISAGQLSSSDFSLVKPSICNRLDRNTSGLILFGKTLLGLQTLNQIIKNRELDKYYRCILHGELKKDVFLKGYLKKNKKTNKVFISEEKTHEGASIETHVKVLATANGISYAEIKLITGKSHQIRAHLSHIGHPIVGDHKYGFKNSNATFKKEYHIQTQMLHAYRLKFPELNEPFDEVSEKEYIAPLPVDFEKLLQVYFK